MEFNMIKVTDFPTDKYNRYPALIKELVKATGVAERSVDNQQQLLDVVDVIVQKYTKKVSPKTSTKTKT
jgi:hypothetical protein